MVENNTAEGDARIASDLMDQAIRLFLDQIVHHTPVEIMTEWTGINGDMFFQLNQRLALFAAQSEFEPAQFCLLEILFGAWLMKLADAKILKDLVNASKAKPN